MTTINSIICVMPESHIQWIKNRTQTQGHQSVIIYRFILCQRVAGGAVPISATSGDRRGTPWTVRQSIAGPHTDRDKQPFTLTLTPMVNLECPIYLSPHCMFLDCGRKPENPERTHAHTGRTCKLHAERPLFQPGLEPGSSRCKARVLTTTPWRLRLWIRTWIFLLWVKEMLLLVSRHGNV